MNNTRRSILGSRLGVFIALAATFSLRMQAAAASGLPWEKPMTAIATSLTGPVAYAIGLIGIAIAGGAMLWGGELTEFGRRACMRLKPTRIVVGEVRGAEAHTLLKAWNTGHPGGAATVHANDALSGLIRLESLVAEATSAPQQALIAEAVDLVIFVDEESSVKAGRKVREVLLVTGYSNGNYQVERV